MDWTKHAFITKFNDISPDVYSEYRSILAKDLASSQHQKVCIYMYMYMYMTVHTEIRHKSAKLILRYGRS